MEEYGWLGLGGGFLDPDPDNRIPKFMDNVLAANRHLSIHVDSDTWRRASGLRAVYLVLQHRSGVGEPDITPIGRAKDGVRSFVVDYDWLTDAHLEPNTGPWLVMAAVLLVLTTISADAGIPMPQLPAVPF